MRTRLSVCARKARFPTEEEALAVAQRASYPLRPYRCERCRQFHLTGRTKGKRTPAFALERGGDVEGMAPGRTNDRLGKARL